VERVKREYSDDHIVTGSQTVLLVDDDDPIRNLSCLYLRSKGYTVLQASNGAEALAVAAQHQGPIHLLITDTVMPGMSAPELVQRLQAQRPGTRVLYISGYTEDTIPIRGIPWDKAVFLQKPFSKASLISKVKQLLDG
jgi:two-component system, cell cycle sensor histidine kinase and response regulator CckA